MQTSGEALYTSDVGLGGSELHAAPVLSTQALATLEHIDASRALKVTHPPALVMHHLFLIGRALHHSLTLTGAAAGQSHACRCDMGHLESMEARWHALRALGEVWMLQ